MAKAIVSKKAKKNGLNKVINAAIPLKAKEAASCFNVISAIEPEKEVFRLQG